MVDYLWKLYSMLSEKKTSPKEMCFGVLPQITLEQDCSVLDKLKLDKFQLLKSHQCGITQLDSSYHNKSVSLSPYEFVLGKSLVLSREMSHMGSCPRWHLKWCTIFIYIFKHCIYLSFTPWTHFRLLLCMCMQLGSFHTLQYKFGAIEREACAGCHSVKDCYCWGGNSTI